MYHTLPFTGNFLTCSCENKRNHIILITAAFLTILAGWYIPKIIDNLDDTDFLKNL